jgi:hypothetical protein
MYSIFPLHSSFILNSAFQKTSSQHHTHSSKTATAATTPNPSAPCTRNALDPLVVDFALPALVVEEPDASPFVPDEPDEELPDAELPGVDVDVAPPGRLTVAWAARAWNAARVLFVAALGSVSKTKQKRL